jgi:nucleoside-diphosphate-sugar epimerase
MNSSAREKVVVIGGGGFIGRPLTHLLLAAGRDVTIVSRSAGGSAQEPGVTYVRGNVADAGSMMSAIEGASVVYDLAMGGGDSWADYRRDFVRGTFHVAQACLHHKVRRLIYVSSTSALYMGSRCAADETLGPDPLPEKRSFYSRGKIEAERVLAELRAKSGLPVVIVRPAVVLGAGGVLIHGGTGQWGSGTCCMGWGRGRNPLPLVLAQDVAQALFAAADAPDIDGRSFNLAGDVRLSAAEYVSAVSARALRSFRFYPRHPWQIQAVEIFKWMIKAAARKKDNAFPSYRDMKSRCLLTDLDCSAAKAALGWKPVDRVDVFLREAIDCHLTPIPAGDLRLPAAG